MRELYNSWEEIEKKIEDTIDEEDTKKRYHANFYAKNCFLYNCQHSRSFSTSYKI